MRAFVALVLLAAAASALTDQQHWVTFKQKYNKVYSMIEEGQRFAIFRRNLAKAEAMNQVGDDATYGITRFSDLTSEEFIAKHTGLQEYRQWASNLKPFPFTEKNKTVGTDWMDTLVTSVKDQGSCGSCWAFSATAAAEGCLAKTSGTPQDLSPQQIMDCCNLGSACNGGCNGGMEYTALEWAVKNDLAALKDYPYKGYKGTCKKVTNPALPAGTCDYYSCGKTEKAMMACLEHSTVTIALDATQLQLYSSGVISKCSGTSLNHALLLVSDEGEGSAYVVKNSWGESWGEDGFFRMVKNKGCLGINLDIHAVAY